MPRHSRASATKDDVVRLRDELQSQLEALERRAEPLRARIAKYDEAIAVLEEVEGPRTASARTAPRPSLGEVEKVRIPAAPHQRGPIDKTVLEICRRAIFAQTDHFQPLDVHEYLKRHHPDVAAKVTSSYISTLIWRETQRGTIAVIRRGGRGLPSTYAIISKR